MYLFFVEELLFSNSAKNKYVIPVFELTIFLGFVFVIVTIIGES